LTAVCAATSPVAGLLLALAGATHVLATRRPLAGLALVAPAFLVAIPLELLFPEGGWEPFAASSVTATLAVTLAFLYAVPREERLLRVGAFVYLGVAVLSIVPTPMGSNIDRYAVLLAGPLALCALGRGGFRQAGRPLAAVVIAVGGIVVWTAWGPVRESAGIVGDPSTRAAYYVPLERFLDAHGGRLARVEVPFTHSHWEAALLAPEFFLARGWERQLDTKYDPIFFKSNLTAAAYHAWLADNAVSYVALPDVRLDGSSDEEAGLIRSGLPYLREVFSSAHCTRSHAAGLSSGAAQRARPRLLHAALSHAWQVASEVALHALLDRRGWAGVRRARTGRVDCRERQVRRCRACRRTLFAGARFRARRCLWMTTAAAPVLAVWLAEGLALVLAWLFAALLVPGGFALWGGAFTGA